MIYHIVKENDWPKCKDEKFYFPKFLDDVGFIHCSTKDQVLPTVNRRYLGIENLLLIAINEEKVVKTIKFEDLKRVGEKHPHIYGSLSLDSVVEVLKFELKDGEFKSFPKVRVS